ncbi:MAG: malonyl-ACP O-methyltransferase BioC [Candidatus Omnitrophica bacterium]|nr:malonyl-ACP O-methyltransferase BioC [Candidatus Omnitrophota bacterium]
MIKKVIIEENFSKHAWDYDQHSKVQNFCASTLIERVKGKSFSKILDIGCGTGNYTKLLREKFSKAKIVAIDISSEMIKVAKKKLEDKEIEFIVADAQEFRLEEEFDLISSNASFQWFQDLKLDLIKYREALSAGGTILFSTFGPETFFQLHSCLKEFLNKPVAISASNFLKRAEIERILKDIFKEVSVREEIYNQEYDSLLELLENLRCTGTRGDGLRGEIFWTSRRIAQIEKIYKKRFSAEGGKSIVATYQMLFCRGNK